MWTCPLNSNTMCSALSGSEVLQVVKFRTHSRQTLTPLMKLLWNKSLCRPQVKNILYHCVKEVVSSLKKGSSEEDDEEENSWPCLGLGHAFQRGTQLPSAPRSPHGHLFMRRTVSRDRQRWSGQSWSCDPGDLKVGCHTPNLQCQEETRPERPLDWQGLNLQTQAGQRHSGKQRTTCRLGAL